MHDHRSSQTTEMLILLYLHTTVDPLSRLHVLEMVVRWCVYIILVPPRQLFNSSPNFQISSTAFNKINRSVSVSELTNQTAVSSRSISIAIDFALRFINCHSKVCYTPLAQCLRDLFTLGVSPLTTPIISMSEGLPTFFRSWILLQSSWEKTTLLTPRWGFTLMLEWDL